jgi:hypothetical protein
VALASAGTGFLLLCSLGYAMSHADHATSALLRLAWCLTPLAATVHLAAAVARTDPATRPRPGLSAIGLGPGRLMTISATTTALSCTLGSLLALVVFLQLRGDLAGGPPAGTAAQFLAADQPLPFPAALTLLALVPAISSATVALLLRPRDARPATGRPMRGYGRFGAYGRSVARETFGAYGRFGAHGRTTASRPAGTDGATEAAAPSANGSGPAEQAAATPDPDPTRPPSPRTAPVGLPWGIAVLAAGLAVEAYADRTTDGSRLALPGGLAAGTPGVLAGWALTALGLALAGPGLTHLCGRLLQSARPGALRLLAGRVLMEEATRIGRPLGVVCAVASGVFAVTALLGTDQPGFGPLSTLGTLLVAGCTVATLLTAAVEAKHERAGTTAALMRLGAPVTMLRSAAALRAGALLAAFAPLTLVVAELAALPLARR